MGNFAINTGGVATNKENMPSIDVRFGPYESVAAAHIALSRDGLCAIGLTVGIIDSNNNTIVEYWYQGGTAQANLVEKNSKDVLPFGLIVDSDIQDIQPSTENEPTSIVYSSYRKRFIAAVTVPGTLGATYYYAWPNYEQYVDTAKNNAPYGSKVYLCGGKTYVWNGIDLVAGGGEQIQSDWNQSNRQAKDYIKNKPAIPEAQIQSDWEQTNEEAKDYIKHKPDIPDTSNLATKQELSSGLASKADKSEMSITPGTGANADKTTIQLKSDTSATVLTQHQDISGKAEKTEVTTEYNRALAAEADLRTLYNNLQQSLPEPVNALPEQGEAGKIYRLAGSTSYADYMYHENDLTTPIKMAEYDNAIDDEPYEGSDNISKSGGIAKYLAKSETVVDSPEGQTNTAVFADGSTGSVDGYTVVTGIILQPGESIVLNKGNEVYLGYNIAVLFKTNNGQWEETLVTRSGSKSLDVVVYTNITNAVMTLGTCTYTNERSYVIKKNVAAASKDAIIALGVTNDSTFNGIIKELYLTGLESNTDYIVMYIRKTDSVCGIYIAKAGSTYALDNAVANVEIRDSAERVPFVDVVERKSSGVSGYAIVDWEALPSTSGYVVITGVVFNRPRIDTLDFNPTIAAHLIDAETKEELEAEIAAIEPGGGSVSAGGAGNDVYAIAKDIKENRSYFLNEDYSNEISYDDDSSYLDAKIRSIPDGKHFLFVTDSHIGYDRGMELKETEIMAYVKAKINAGCVVFGGDAIGQQDTPYKAAKELAVYAEDKFNAFGGDFLWCQGNHDANANTNSANSIPSEEIYKRTTKVMQRYGKAVFDTEGIALIDGAGLSAADTVKAKAWMNLHYYYDDNRNKIRFIVIETGDGSDGAGIMAYSWDGWQLLIGYITFIGEALQSTPDGWDVVICMHQLQRETDFENGEITTIRVSPTGQFYRMISAFKNHGTSSVGIDASVASKAVLNHLMNARITNEGKTYDFTNRTSGNVFLISGHFHMDDAWVIQNSNPASNWNYAGKEYGQWDTILDNAFLAIQTDRAAINDKGGWAGSTKSPHGVTAPNNSEVTRIGTKNEVLFDVVTITPDNKVICTRIGAGSDREYNIP